MKKEMIEALNGKYVFTDIDGTLMEYRFNGRVGAKRPKEPADRGFGQTSEEIEQHVFVKNRPLKSIIRILEKANVMLIFTINDITSITELLDKSKWLEQNCSTIRFQDHIWFILPEYWSIFKKYFKDNKTKTRCAMSRDQTAIATDYGILMCGTKNRLYDFITQIIRRKPEDCVMIDDVFVYLRNAESKGMTAYHISSFIK